MSRRTQDEKWAIGEQTHTSWTSELDETEETKDVGKMARQRMFIHPFIRSVSLGLLIEANYHVPW